MRIRACSEPPPSPTGCTERMRLLRVAVNAEQLLYRSPGGIGRYTSGLLTVMPRVFPDVEPVAFTALHRRRDVAAAFDAAGVEADALMLPIPRPLLYEAWHTLGTPGIPRAWKADLVHAPSL